MEKKTIKGQVTIFLILGIVIVLIIAFFIYLGLNIQSSSLERYSPELADDIEGKIRSCVESYAEDGLMKIGKQGGYIALPRRFLRTNYSSIAYSYWRGDIVLRSLKDIENELSKYIDINLARCVDFESFPKAKITAKAPLTKVTIRDEKVDVSTVFRLLIQRNEQSFTIKDPFLLSYDIRLGYLYEELQGILNKKASDSIAEPFLDEQEKDYKLTFFEYDQGTEQVYFFYDPRSAFKGKNYYMLVSVLAV